MNENFEINQPIITFQKERKTQKLSGLREELARLEKVNLILGGDLNHFCFGFFLSQKPSKRLKIQHYCVRRCLILFLVFIEKKTFFRHV